MASPRTAWRGAVQLALLNVPVTIGKAWAQGRETGLRDLCAVHKTPVDRTERCSKDADCDLSGGKIKGVEKSNGSWHAFNENEYVTIEDSTKSDTLTVLDVQPLSELPMHLSLGTYYLRRDKNVRASEAPFAILAAALGKTGFGLVVKWCSVTTQKLCVIHERDGIILLNPIPMANELREAGIEERAHEAVEVGDASLDMAVKLLTKKRGRKKFDHAAYQDDGLALRQAAVEKILDGKQPDEKGKTQPKSIPNAAEELLRQLKASMAEA